MAQFKTVPACIALDYPKMRIIKKNPSNYSRIKVVKVTKLEKQSQLYKKKGP